jgi:NCS2 family nucleobase:cation symporter-2
MPDTARILLTSGLLPAAAIAIVLNLVLPEELSEESTEEVSGGLAGHGKGSLPHEDPA